MCTLRCDVCFALLGAVRLCGGGVAGVAEWIARSPPKAKVVCSSPSAVLLALCMRDLTAVQQCAVYVVGRCLV